MFSSAPDDGDNRVGAIRSLGDRVAAERDPRSFVVTLSVWTNDAEKSVTVSKAIVKAFESELFQTTSDSSQRVVDDLKKRLEEMRENVTIAEKRGADSVARTACRKIMASTSKSRIRRAECVGACDPAAPHSGKDARRLASCGKHRNEAVRLHQGENRQANAGLAVVTQEEIEAVTFAPLSRCRMPRSRQTRSSATAIPCPTPMHMAASARRLPVSESSSAAVPAMRAPDMPSG